MATKKAETKPKAEVKAEETQPKAETKKVVEEEYVEVFVPYDESTDEEELYVGVNGGCIRVPYGQTVRVKYPYAAEIRRKFAHKQAMKNKQNEAKRRDDAYTNMYINSTT